MPDHSFVRLDSGSECALLFLRCPYSFLRWGAAFFVKLGVRYRRPVLFFLLPFLRFVFSSLYEEVERPDSNVIYRVGLAGRRGWSKAQLTFLILLFAARRRVRVREVESAACFIFHFQLRSNGSMLML